MAIRIGILGGRRGGSFNVALDFLKDRIQLAAVCDLSADVRQRWLKDFPDIAAYASLDQMLADDKVDAVLVASPMPLHAEHSLKCLQAGKHVLSEVAACTSHDEATALIEAVEQSGKTYMLAENYCYMRPHMMVLNMVEQGVFGELTYAEGMYLHDVFNLHFHDDGSPTWRSEMRRTMPGGNRYPTHSFGPIAQWMGIGKTDQIKTLYSLSTPAHGRRRLYNQVLGEASPFAKGEDWKVGDSCSNLIKTDNGCVIYLRIDSDSYRPHHMTVHELQGSKACYRTQARSSDEPLFWVEGISEVAETRTLNTGQVVPGVPTKWNAMSDLIEQFEHPRWKQHGETAKKAGHGGGDFFILEDFVNAIDGSAANPIDVYTAATWSSVIWLSQQSEKLEAPVPAIRYEPATAAAK